MAAAAHGEWLRRQYDPTEDPLARLWWDPRSLSAGAVASWVDRIASVAANQNNSAKQPTKSDTVIGGQYPGVTGDGARVLVAAGAGPVLASKTQLTLTLALFDTDAAVKVPIELTANGTSNNGGFFLAVNDPAGPRINGGIRGTAGYTERYITEALSSVKVVSMGLNFAVAGSGAIAFARVNGVTQTLTDQIAGSGVGSAANDALYLFGRGTTPTLGWVGTFGDVIFRESVAQDEALKRAERWVGSRVGLAI